MCHVQVALPPLKVGAASLFFSALASAFWPSISKKTKVNIKSSTYFGLFWTTYFVPTQIAPYIWSRCGNAFERCTTTFNASSLHGAMSILTNGFLALFT
jgi:hypothetical protein